MDGKFEANSIISVLRTLLNAYKGALEIKGKARDYESAFIHGVIFNTKVNCESLKSIYEALSEFYNKKEIPDSQTTDLTKLAILQKPKPISKIRSILKSIFFCCSRQNKHLQAQEKFKKHLKSILHELGIEITKKPIQSNEPPSIFDLMSDSIPTIDTRSYVWKKIIEDEDNPAKVITNDEVKQTLGGL